MPKCKLSAKSMVSLQTPHFITPLLTLSTKNSFCLISEIFNDNGMLWVVASQLCPVLLRDLDFDHSQPLGTLTSDITLFRFWRLSCWDQNIFYEFAIALLPFLPQIFLGHQQVRPKFKPHKPISPSEITRAKLMKPLLLCSWCSLCRAGWSYQPLFQKRIMWRRGGFV